LELQGAPPGGGPGLPKNPKKSWELDEADPAPNQRKQHHQVSLLRGLTRAPLRSTDS